MTSTRFLPTLSYKNMIILGLDPGTTLLGYGLIERQGQKLKTITYGCINTRSQSQEKKLQQIEQELQELIKKYRPDCLAVEKLFFSKNVKTALAVSEAKGVVMLCAEKNRKPVYYYAPTQVKQAVVGYGHADKKQVQKMVQLILKLKEIPRPDDTADALAVAVCCAHSEKN